MLRYTQIRKDRLADLVGSQLKESIFEGQYKSGQRMPSEHQLVEMFGVSRMIVREAIRDLERAGLIEVKRGPLGGAFVLSMKHDSVSRVIKDLLRLGKANVADIMEVRLGIEPIVAGLAAERRNEEDLEILANCLKAIPEDPGGDEYVSWNVSFHRLVARASHNPMYEILVNILMDFTEELVLSIKPRERVVHDTISHPAIYEKIKRGEAEGASRKFRDHLEDILPLLQTLEKKLPKKLLH
ncbi:MAG: FadR family transcriptional regulator [Desulfobacteraceae bacterium]|nr:FadR family transcriptional regulator [Desulfobacteraceae bacterium]